MKPAPGPAAILAVGLPLLMLSPPDPAMREPMYAAGLLLLFIGLWACRAVPDHLAAILFFLAASVVDLVPPAVIFVAFRSDVVWLLLGGFVVSATAKHTGLDRRIALLLLVPMSGGYRRVVAGSALVGVAFVFVVPSAVGRIILLVPIVAGLADRLGFAPGSNGRAGVVLGAAVPTLLAAYAVLPSTIPNLVMTGTAEQLFGVVFTYGGYLLVNFPVLALLAVGATPAGAGGQAGLAGILAATLASATGLPLATVLLAQIPSWMFFPLPYEMPALVVAASLGGVTLRQCTRLLLWRTVLGFTVAVPLQFLWMWSLGMLG